MSHIVIFGEIRVNIKMIQIYKFEVLMQIPSGRDKEVRSCPFACTPDDGGDEKDVVNCSPTQ